MLLLQTLKLTHRDRFDHSVGYFLPWKDAMVPQLRAHDIEVVCFEARSIATILLSALRVANHVRVSGVELLHCHLPIAGVVGRLAGRIADVPVIYTEHSRIDKHHPLTRALNLATWRMQERAIAVSVDVAESIRKHATPRVPVSVVLNGVDVDTFTPRPGDAAAVRRALKIPPDAPVVGTVAVFRREKRLDDWLHAAAILRQQVRQVHFVMVGDGVLSAELRSLARSLGLGDIVHFPGLQSDVRPFLAAMDVYMMSSDFEGLPVALLEAMAMRCAIVATAVGGVPEAVRDGEEGLLIEPGRPEELAAAAARLLSDPVQLPRFGAASRMRVEERFSMRRMVRELETIYAEVLDSHDL